MATPTIVDNNTILDRFETITNVTSSDSGVSATALAAYYREPGACVFFSIPSGYGYAYKTITSVDLSNTYLWGWAINVSMLQDSIANGGTGIILSDGTNTISYHVGGSDDFGFRLPASAYQGCFVLNTTNLPANFTVIAGVEANLNLAAITGVGYSMKPQVGFGFAAIDIMRYGDQGIKVYGGTSGDKLTFSDISDADEAQTANGAYGVIHQTASQQFSIQQKLTLGDNVGTNDCYFEDSSFSITWFPRDVEAGAYEIEIVSNATGVTHVTLGTKSGAQGINGGSIICPAIKGNFTATDANINQLNLYAPNFQRGANIHITCPSEILTGSFPEYDSVTFGSNVTANFCNFISGVGALTPAGATMDSTTVLSSTATGAILLSSPSDCANISNLSMSGNDRAIIINDASNNTYTFDNYTFSGNTFDVRQAGAGDITIIITNGGDIPTTEITGAGSITLQQNASIALPNILDGTRVQLYNVTKASELSISVVSGGSGYSTTVDLQSSAVDSGDTLAIRCAYYDTAGGNVYDDLEVLATITAAGFSGAQSQTVNSIISGVHAKGTDYHGQNVTGFSFDGVNLQIDSNIVDINGQKLATWAKYNIASTDDGLRVFFNFFDAINERNFISNKAVQVENLGLPAVWTAASWTRADGVTIVAPTSNTIQFNNGLLSIPTVGGDRDADITAISSSIAALNTGGPYTG